MCRNIVMIVIVAAGLCLVYSIAAAGDELTYGPVSIKASLDVSAVYDDNLFLDFDHERDDYYYEILPQFEFILPLGSSIFDLKYGYQTLSFQSFTSENEENHRVDFSGIIGAGDKLSFELANSFHQFSDAVIVDVTNRVTREITRTDMQGVYEFGENYELLLAYARGNYDYELGLAGRNEDEYHAELSYRFRPNISLLGGYTRGEVDLKGSSEDASFNRYHVGARGQFLKDINAELRIGSENRDYDLSVRDDLTELYISGAASYRLSDTALLQLEAERKIVEAVSVEQNSYLYRTAELMFEKWLTEIVKANVRTEYHETDFEKRTTPDARGPREDKLWLIAADMSYFLKDYLSVGLGWESQVNGSNFKEMDYEHNLIKATLRLAY